MDSMSRLNGGLFEAERNLQRELTREKSYHVQVVGLRDEFSDRDLQDWAPLLPIACRVSGPRAFGYSPEMMKALLETRSDLAYSAGLWKYPSWAAARWARKQRRPLVVAPHGMLDPWALRHSRVRKVVAGWLYQNAQLNQAACLRALCRNEAQALRAYGLKNPICIIPNGVTLPDCHHNNNGAETTPLDGDGKIGKKVLLYLGRLHPKKGLTNLLEAWRLVQLDKSTGGNSGPSDWMLAVAGWNQGHYETDLRRQVVESRIEHSVSFLGPRFGRDKAECYRTCDAIILPSFSEGIPMVVLEAWSHRKPVLMTPQCNLSDGFSAHAAIQVETTPESIRQGLRTLFDMSINDRQSMGQRGFKLVSEGFTWPRIASQMRSLLTWVVEGGQQPGNLEFL
jgi:poly(glycerol-phosphate) alpha-glucosyltransferase